MTATVTLGRIAGIRVGVHWSVLGIVAILAGLGIARWPDAIPGQPTAAYVVAALAGAALFLASLLAHELAHALVARRHGIPVDGITLWLLGGVARLRGEASTPAAEFRIAAVGPLASVVVAAVCGVLAWVSVLVALPPLVFAVLAFLSLINVVLALFNLVPAAPLDGGRILRSLLWAWRGDRYRAAVASARAGKVFGLALIALGGVWLLAAAGANGIWWILIGLFIVLVASVEEHQARTFAALSGLRVRDAMTPNPERVDGATSLAAFVDDLAPTRKHSAYPVVDPTGRPLGLMTLDRVGSVRRERWPSTPLDAVAHAMTAVPTVGPDDELAEVLPRLQDGRTDGRGLVVEGGGLVGIITPSDISRIATLRGLSRSKSAGLFTGRGAGWP
ncbi:site-2 protease family protein [Haloechinothrix sp. LS1_15]|uniref:site-2 protease family protein n=1 Tax=Haloechinothrix sp. LS1_15 TaxID=2652248 RepID=UPI002945BBC9|nr:site-2 protease family protein [Haloechinothrix sp. LS1_15]MDV6014669.1 CBS domain-containing protein [Haloechinothrix sp. LS1_15]